MPVFAYSIAADQYHPSEGDGYVRAETTQVAFGGFNVEGGKPNGKCRLKPGGSRQSRLGCVLWDACLYFKLVLNGQP